VLNRAGCFSWAVNDQSINISYKDDCIVRPHNIDSHILKPRKKLP